MKNRVMKMSNKNDVEMLAELSESVKSIKSELSKVIVGQTEVIDDILAALISGGHSLLIGVPGLAKTLLVSTLSKSLNLNFNRIQFTPDLMPSDITGSEILYEDKSTGHREFRFIKGPVFSNIVLADEINRTPPKTQSALLEAMQEQHVTSSGKTYDLPNPFWVLATQNPIEQEGTYPLPEAQQDRFMFSIEIDYPDFQTEIDIVKQTTSEQNYKIVPVLSEDKIIEYRELLLRVPVSDSLIKSAVCLARSTRPNDKLCPESLKKMINWGAGPRASQFLILAAKAFAILDGRPTPDIKDIYKAAFPVLRHRIFRSFNAEADNISTNEIIEKLLKENQK